MWRSIHHACGARGRLCKLMNRASLLHHLMGDSREPSIQLGTQTHMLDRRGAIADHRKHLLTRQGHLHRSSLYKLGSHDRQKKMWITSFRAKASSDKGRDHADPFRWEMEGFG